MYIGNLVEVVEHTQRYQSNYILPIISELQAAQQVRLWLAHEGCQWKPLSKCP